MIKDYKNIDDYLRTSKPGVEKKLNDFVVFNHEDFNHHALMSQSSYRHHFFELSLDIREGCSFQIDNFKFPLQGNRLMIISPNRLQTNIVHRDLRQKSKWFTIFFEVDFLSAHFNLSRFKSDFTFFAPNISPVFNLTDKQLHELSNLFNLIKYEQKEYGETNREVIRNLTNVIFEKAKAYQRSTQVKDEKPTSSLVKEFLYLCNTSFLTLHAVKEYAHKLSVTPKHLTEIVKEQTGLTALETIHQMKVSYAKGLLTQTTMSVKQIAFELGFESPEYFTVFFKKITGVAPNQFRQN